MEQIDLILDKETNRYTLPVARFSLFSGRSRYAAIAALAASFLQAACTTETMAAADPRPDVMPAAADGCAASLSSLEQAAYGDGSGHLEALQTLATCYDRLGQGDRAAAIRWRLYQDRTDY